MDFTTEIENGKIHLYCWENGRKVSDYVLDMKEAQHLVRALLQIIKPWKYAQGEDLPEYDREVIVLIQDYPDDPTHLRVAYGHRPKPDGYVTSKDEKIYPMTHGKCGWNGDNVKYWLDLELPINT